MIDKKQSVRPSVRAALLAAAALFAISTESAQTAPVAPREGVNYTVVKPAQATEAPAGKVEVIEFFGYWCPHCNDFEPTLTDWSKRNDAKSVMAYVPIAFQSSTANLQRLYYALDALGKERELRRKVFSSIHADRSLSPTADIGDLASWAEKNGIDKKKFTETINSFSVQTRGNRANQIAAAYGVTSVPALGIGGRYLVSVDPRSMGNVDYFVNRALTEK